MENRRWSKRYRGSRPSDSKTSWREILRSSWVCECEDLQVWTMRRAPGRLATRATRVRRRWIHRARDKDCGGRYRLVRHVSCVLPSKKNLFLCRVLIKHSFVDCPGHDILMSTVLSGAAVMDAALSSSPERIVSTTANFRASSSYRNHEARSYHHPTEQGRPHASRRRRTSISSQSKTSCGEQSQTSRPLSLYLHS